MRRAWPVLLVLALAVVAGPAQAQSSSGLLFAFGPGKLLAETDMPAAFHGELVVSFHGDAAAGCSAYGVCGYAGTVIVRPRGGSLGIITYRLRRRVGHQATLFLNGFGNGLTTWAKVQRTAPGAQGGTCVDARSAVFGPESGAMTHGRSITIMALSPGGSMLQTRCAGPLDRDLASLSPRVAIPVVRARHGRMVVNLSGSRAFAAHGFAGTLTSTLVMKLGRPSPGSSSSSSSFPPGIKVERIRTVTERLRLVRITGRLAAAVRGASDPVVCRLLDTCGLSGTLTLGRSPDRVAAVVVAMAPASRPYVDFLTALGLTRSGRAHGIAVSVFVSWSASVHANVSQAGTTCTDVAGTGAVSLTLGTFFGGSAEAGSLAGSWRTRCPGPILESVSPGLSTSLPAGVLTRPRFTLNVRAGATSQDDGYVIAPQGRLSVVLRRGRISQQVNLQPLP